jgi:hypothetical protein
MTLLRRILGHSQISMTSQYAHVLPQVMTDAADRLGKALWGSTTDPSGVVTIGTVAVSPDWASATTAIGTVAVAVVAVGVALFIERRAGQRLREEHKRSDDLLREERTLHAQEITEERAIADKRLAEKLAHSDAQLAEERAHLAEQLQDDRIWNRPVDLYARISLALRRYIEKPPTGPNGKPMLAPDVLGLANFASEATMLASKHLADLLNQFMYDFPESLAGLRPRRYRLTSACRKSA